MTQFVSKSAKANFVKNILPDNWQEQAGASFSDDDLIDAYLKGTKDGKSSHEKIILDRFKENVIKATGVAEKFISMAKERGITLINAHLKAEDVAKFTVLFIVDEDDFTSDAFREIYLLARGVKESN